MEIGKVNINGKGLVRNKLKQIPGLSTLLIVNMIVNNCDSVGRSIVLMKNNLFDQNSFLFFLEDNF